MIKLNRSLEVQLLINPIKLMTMNAAGDEELTAPVCVKVAVEIGAVTVAAWRSR